MFRRLIFYLVLLTAMPLGNSCAPTPTPAPTSTPVPMTLVAPLAPYTKPPNPCPRGSGSVTYQSPMVGGFSGTLQLSGLIPDQWYTFTINGWEGREGNEELKAACPHPGGGITGYCDYPVHANAQGEVNQLITIGLPMGQYVIKYLVKDDSQDYCIMLYNDAPPKFEIR